MMVTLWAIAVVERGYEGGEGPIQEDLGRIEDLEAGRGGVVVGTSKRESMVCCWCLIVSLAMRLAAGLGSLSVGVCGLEAACENGRGAGTSACSKMALMLRNCGLALRLRCFDGFVGDMCMVRSGFLNGSALGEGLIGGGDVMWAVAMCCFHRPGSTCNVVEGNSDWKDWLTDLATVRSMFCCSHFPGEADDR